MPVGAQVGEARPGVREQVPDDDQQGIELGHLVGERGSYLPDPAIRVSIWVLRASIRSSIIRSR